MKLTINCRLRGFLTRFCKSMYQEEFPGRAAGRWFRTEAWSGDLEREGPSDSALEALGQERGKPGFENPHLGLVDRIRAATGSFAARLPPRAGIDQVPASRRQRDTGSFGRGQQPRHRSPLQPKDAGY